MRLRRNALQGEVWAESLSSPEVFGLPSAKRERFYGLQRERRSEENPTQGMAEKECQKCSYSRRQHLLSRCKNTFACVSVTMFPSLVRPKAVTKTGNYSRRRTVEEKKFLLRWQNNDTLCFHSKVHMTISRSENISPLEISLAVLRIAKSGSWRVYCYKFYGSLRHSTKVKTCIRKGGRELAAKKARETSQKGFLNGKTRKHMLSRPKFFAGSKTVADKSRKHLSPQHMFPAWLKLESFASAITFSSLLDLSGFANQTHKLENFVSQLSRTGNMLRKRIFESKNIFESLPLRYIYFPSILSSSLKVIHAHLSSLFFVIKESLVSNIVSITKNYQQSITDSSNSSCAVMFLDLLWFILCLPLTRVFLRLCQSGIKTSKT